MKKKGLKIISTLMIFILMLFNMGIVAKAATPGEDLVNYAKTFIGTPYLYGGTSPDTGFDCSGFTQYVYKHFGIDITRTTYTQINVGTPVSQIDLQPGDLVFPSTGHVGIYVGNNQIIHSPQTGDVVKISTIWSFYAARRILPSFYPYTYEGIAFYAYPLQQSGTIPVYRYYNNKEHFYTTNFNELGYGKLGYTYEGVAFYIYPSQEFGTVPVYRYFNGTDHFYTTNFNELGYGKLGYTYEQIAFYAYPSQPTGTVPVYRCFNQYDHFYTTNSLELP